jgi:hypothetical protein
MFPGENFGTDVVSSSVFVMEISPNMGRLSRVEIWAKMAVFQP